MLGFFIIRLLRKNYFTLRMLLQCGVFFCQIIKENLLLTWDAALLIHNHEFETCVYPWKKQFTHHGSKIQCKNVRAPRPTEIV